MVTFNTEGNRVFIDGKSYMKGDIYAKLINTGYEFYANDPLKKILNWVSFNNAVDGSSGNAFTSISEFTTWVNSNLFIQPTASGVQSVTGTLVTGTSTNPIVNIPTAAQVGLGSVNNTSDAAKPVSTATQTALNAKLTATTAQFNSKLTATQGAAVPNSAATDVAGLVSDFNSLLASLRTAGVIAS